MTTLINTTPNDWEIVTLPMSWDSQTQAWKSTHPQTGESRLYFRGQWWEISDSDCKVLEEKTSLANAAAKFKIFKEIYTSEVGSWDLRISESFMSNDNYVTLTHQRPFLSDEQENDLEGDEAWECWGGKELLAALDLEPTRFESFEAVTGFRDNLPLYWHTDQAFVILSKG